MKWWLRTVFLKAMFGLGYRVESIQARRITVANVLEEAFKDRVNVVFVQIGAHDGMRNDPVAPLRKRTGWSGVIVEANPVIFPRLVENLAATPAVKAVNVAVASHAGTVSFTSVGNPSATRCPDWADQISSLSREFVVDTLAGWGHERDEAEALAVTKEVPCCSFEELLRVHSIGSLNLLMLDVEGMDFELLKHFPFGLCSPEWIVFESSHLGSEARQALPEFLCRLGYSFFEIGEDTVCRRWRSVA